jgi:hypothetical protein
MYQFFGIKACLTFFGTICGIVLATWWWLWPPTQPNEVWRLITSSVGVVGVFTVMLGQTPAFPWLCRQPGIRNFFPDIDGRWTGTLESNWPEIQKRANLVTAEAASSSAPVSATVAIKSRLFFVRINLDATSGYSTSKTIFVRVTRDQEDGEVRLNYMYVNTTLKPLAMDSDRHHGAAYLDLKNANTNQPRLEGVYWTNRNWHNALNTAGTIMLRRS